MFLMIMVEIGQITPPVGCNRFVLLWRPQVRFEPRGGLRLRR